MTLTLGIYNESDECLVVFDPSNLEQEIDSYLASTMGEYTKDDLYFADSENEDRDEFFSEMSFTHGIDSYEDKLKIVKFCQRYDGTEDEYEALALLLADKGAEWLEWFDDAYIGKFPSEEEQGYRFLCSQGLVNREEIPFSAFTSIFLQSVSADFFYPSRDGNVYCFRTV